MNTGLFRRMQGDHDALVLEVIHLREQINEQFQNNYFVLKRLREIEDENTNLKKMLAVPKRNTRSSLQSHKGVDMR